MTRGDVILCRFPHARGTAAKLRPVLVVQSDYYNSRIANLLVASITSNLKNAADPAHVLIDVATVEGQQTGLTQNSLVSCINLAVIPRRDVDRAIGKLSATSMQRVNDALSAALAL
jgi:mRNA-degrading endonuclease toxin of MazEF toxin-antitoxin module